MRKIMKSRSIAVILTILIFVTSLSWDMMTVSAAKEDVTETIEETAEETVAETDSVSDGDEAPEVDPTTEPTEDPAQETDENPNAEEQSEKLEIDSADPLPVAYDSRNVDGVSYVPAIRDQGEYNTDWAFAAIACVEINMIRKGLADTSLDLSEAHLIYFGNFTAKDPLGNDGEDDFYFDGEWWNAANTIYDAKAALVNWRGAALESEFPYSKVTEPLDRIDPAVAYDSAAAHVTGVYLIENGFYDSSKRNSVKQAIMDYGAVAMNYRFDPVYYNEATSSYYCNYRSNLDIMNPGTDDVVIVGWDDNYSKDNFLVPPSRDGAYLARASKGNEWGDQGYFWISYSDLMTKDAVIFEAEEADNYMNNYQYDCAYTGTAETLVTEAANVFTASAEEGKKEELKAISFSAGIQVSGYSIQIYKNLTDLSSPHSGEACLEKPLTGVCNLKGYMTIPLPEPIELNYGETFSIVLTTKSPANGPVKIGYESYSSANTIEGRVRTASAKQGQSFSTQGTGWGPDNYNFTIKAFTDTVDPTVPVTGIEICATEATVETDETITLSASVIPANATNQVVFWVSGDKSIALVDATGVVTGIKPGTTTITARTMNGNYTATCKVTVVKSVTEVSFEYASHYYLLGDKAKPTKVTVKPEDANDRTLTWTSSNPKAISVDQSTGEIEVLAVGIATITATATNGLKFSLGISGNLPEGGYIGNINSELYSFDLKKNDEGKYYLTGEIVVVEWVNSAPFVPKVTPAMTFKSTDGKDEIEVFVTATGTNTYYFDRFIEGLDPNKEYVFEIASADPNNYSPNRSMNVNINTSPRMPKIKNLGKLGEQKLSYYTAEDGEMRLFRRTKEYVGNINSELKWASCTTNEIGNFVTGEIVVVEWENGVSTVPFEKPIMRFKSKKGADMDVFITALGTNTYYFDRCLEDLDTTDEFYFTITSGDEKNISPNKTMIVTTTDMEKKQGTLWETAKQYVKYKTNPNNGQMIIYAEDK